MSRVKRTPDVIERYRLEYVNTNTTLRELAAKHGINRRTLERYSTREDWPSLRRQAAYAATTRAQARITEEKVDELAQWNQDDIRLARALRAQVARTLTLLTQPAGEGQPARVVPIETLRSLASTAESAQRIGRLALGAATANAAVQADSLTSAFARAMAEMADAEERTDGDSAIPGPAAGSLQ